MVANTGSAPRAHNFMREIVLRHNIAEQVLWGVRCFVLVEVCNNVTIFRLKIINFTAVKIAVYFTVMLHVT